MPLNYLGNHAGTAGNDTLWGAAQFVGPDDYRNLPDVLTSSGDYALRGYDGDDVIFGDIYGYGIGRIDELWGGTGNDSLYGDGDTSDPNWATNPEGGDDWLFGEDGNDWLFGQAGDDVLDGGAGNDTLVGGLGADFLSGGDGNDVIWVDLIGTPSASDLSGEAFGNRGADTLHGGNGDDLLAGQADSDRLNGNGGNDTLWGGNDADRLFGGDGNDSMLGGSPFGDADASDSMYGGAGNDYMNGNEGSDRIFGDTGADTLEGSDGDDYLNGGAGDDVLNGGAGNDFYVVGSRNDILPTDGSDNGRDQVQSFISLTLGPDQEVLTLAGAATVGNGNIGANRVNGSFSDNVLRGMGGNDSVFGGAGNDTLFGNDGKDVLKGGVGNDVLFGNGEADWLVGEAGADTFLYQSISESRAGPTLRDFIDDFVFADGDRIDLTQIDANTVLAGDQAFTYIGTQNFDGTAGQLRVYQGGGDLIVSGDVNGDRIADFQVVLDDLQDASADFFLL